MKFTMTKIVAGLALAVLASGAHAAVLQVSSMTLGDTLTLAGALGTDGYQGTFKFGAVTAQNVAGGNLFYGDVNGGVIDMTGSGPYPAANAFTTGFMFASSPFRPDTTGAIDITIDTVANTFTVNSLPWGGDYESAAFQFNMSPDSQPFNKVLISTGANTYAYRMKFNHLVTTADDPSNTYVGFNAFWIIEGTMTTAVPEASTYGMMLAGLGLVGAAVRRRRHRM